MIFRRKNVFTRSSEGNIFPTYFLRCNCKPLNISFGNNTRLESLKGLCRPTVLWLSVTDTSHLKRKTYHKKRVLQRCKKYQSPKCNVSFFHVFFYKFHTSVANGEKLSCSIFAPFNFSNVMLTAHFMLSTLMISHHAKKTFALFLSKCAIDLKVRLLFKC